MKLHWRNLVYPVLLMVAVSSVAQNDNDDSENETENPASVSLNFDRQGGVYVNLNLPSSAPDSTTIADLLAQSFHCRPGILKHPDRSRYDYSLLEKNWSEAKRERYRKQLEEYNRHILTGHCEAALSSDGLALRGDFDYTALASELRRMGADQLSLTMDVPKSPFFEYSKVNLLPVSASPTYILYQIPLKDTPQAATLHLAYGLRRADLQRALAILAGFILLPVLLTLWMRRRALELAKTDAAAAWFGFMRSLNWLVLGGMLAWMSSGFGARDILQEWIIQKRYSALGASTASVALTIVPAFLMYLLCASLSYSIHARLRGTQWSRREFVAQQCATVGAQALPIILLVSGLGILRQQPQLAAGLLISAAVTLQVLTLLKLRLMKAFPQPLMTGDLRDRIFALAKKLGVEVNQIFIIPARKGQMANAYAARNRIVMFTDYLLEHLDRREVDGVAAHELAHLRYKHPAKLSVGLLAAVLLPNYFSWLARTVMGTLMTIPLSFLSNMGVRTSFTFQIWRGLSRFEQWQEKNLVLLAVGMAGFYFLSRHFENVADATAVRLTGDAEAQITGILKVSRLGLIPIRWGKVTESWVTHPSTVNRVHRMAKAGGLSDGRLQQILCQYDAAGSAAKVLPPEDRYSVPSADDPEKMRVALNDRARLQWKLWTHLSVYVLPPALFSLLIVKFHFDGYAAVAAYIAEIAITALLITLVGVWLGESGYDRIRQRVVERLQRERIPAGQIGDLFVGFAPGPFPRFFGTHYYWDAGFLVLSKDGLKFVGEQVKVSFSPAEIDGVAIGRGGPSWWKFERVYIRWKTATGQNGIFNLSSLESGFPWSNRARARRLYAEIVKWRQQPAGYPASRPELSDLKTLELGQVTSITPRKLGGLNANLRILVYLVPLALMVSLLTRAEVVDVLFSMFVLRVIHSIPYWRYRDRVPDFSQGSLPQTAQAQRASAGN